MCYPKPGPRCSAHAKSKLDKTRHAYDRAVALHDFESFDTARTAYREAEAEYNTTPAGLEELRVKLAVAEGDAQIKLSHTYHHAKITRSDAISAYKEATGKDISGEDQGGEDLTGQDNPVLQAAQLEEERRELKKQATWNRHRADRDWEWRRNSDAVGKMEDTLSIIGDQVRAIVKPDAPLSKHSSERLRISQELQRVEKEYGKLAGLEMRSMGEKTDQITRVREGLDRQSTALHYDLDLLSTDPSPTEHPQIIQDREQAARRWNLMGSIEKLLA